MKSGRTCEFGQGCPRERDRGGRPESLCTRSLVRVVKTRWACFDQGMTIANIQDNGSFGRCLSCDLQSGCATVSPIAGARCLDAGLAASGSALEVERCQRFCCRLSLCPRSENAPYAGACPALGRSYSAQNGEERAAWPAFGIGASGNLGPRVCGSLGNPQRGQHAGQRVNVDLAAVCACPQEGHSKLSREGMGDSHISRQCCGLGTSSNTSAFGSGNPAAVEAAAADAPVPLTGCSNWR